MAKAPPKRVVDAVLGTRRRLLAVADRLLPAHLALLDRTIAAGRAAILGTLAELGVADELAAGPRTAAALAPALKVDEDALHRVLRAAAADGVLNMDARGRFWLNRLSEPLRTDHPASMRDWVRYISLPSTTAAWADLTESVRSGQSAFRRVHGTSVWSWFAEHPEEESLFAAAMRRLTENDAPAIVDGYDWPQRGTVCDVAGGVGTLLAAILRERPLLGGVLVDARGVLDSAEEHLRQAGVLDRVALREGDIFEGFDATADIYLLKDVLHDWDDRACARILARLAATMAPGSRVLLVEMLQEPNVADPFASLADIQMLTQCEQGRQRSAAELGQLLRGAGLTPAGVHRTAGPALVEALAG